MNQQIAAPPAQPPAETPETAPETRAPFDPESIFGLIERTAASIRWLQQENERIGVREEMCRTLLERDRAQWRSDVERLNQVAEASLERATVAEAQVEEARAQAKLAMLMCREAQEREQAAGARAATAEKRAETAELWLEKVSNALNDDVVALFKA